MFHYLLLLAADAPRAWAGPSSNPTPRPGLPCALRWPWGLPGRLVHDPSNPPTSSQIGPWFKICDPELISLRSPGPPTLSPRAALLPSQEREENLPHSGGPRPGRVWCFSLRAASLPPGHGHTAWRDHLTPDRSERQTAKVRPCQAASRPRHTSAPHSFCSAAQPPTPPAAQRSGRIAVGALQQGLPGKKLSVADVLLQPRAQHPWPQHHSTALALSQPSALHWAGSGPPRRPLQCSVGAEPGTSHPGHHLLLGLSPLGAGDHRLCPVFTDPSSAGARTLSGPKGSPPLANP